MEHNTFISLRIATEDVAKLDNAARSLGLSRSAMLRRLIRFGLA